MPMFIDVLLKFLWRLWSSGLFNPISDLGNGVSSVSRRCDKLPESGETCEDISEEGVSVNNYCKKILTFNFTAWWIHLLL